MQELVDRTFEKHEYTPCRVCGANIHITKPGKVTSMELVNPSEALVIELTRAYPNPIWLTVPENEQGQYPALVDTRKITQTGILKVPTDQINPANGSKKMELYVLVSCIGELQAS
jgi:hypothetical protein